MLTGVILPSSAIRLPSFRLPSSATFLGHSASLTVGRAAMLESGRLALVVPLPDLALQKLIEAMHNQPTVVGAVEISLLP